MPSSAPTDASPSGPIGRTDGWLLALLITVVLTVVGTASMARAEPMLLAATLPLCAALAALQVRGTLRAAAQGGRSSRLWPLAWTSVCTLAALVRVTPSETAQGWTSAAMLAGCAGAGLTALVARYWRAKHSGLAAWARASTWCLAAAALGVAAGRRAPGVEESVTTVLWWLVVLVAAEGLGRTLSAVFASGAAVTAPTVIAAPFSLANPLSSLFGFLDDRLGLDLRHTWALAWVRNALAPLGLVLAAMAWGVTGLTVIEIHEQGVLERLGRPVADLDPGLHVHWPWPIDHVQRVDVHRVRERTIGYTGATEGASLLWTNMHATEEYALLLGDGRDLIAVNARLQFRPATARAWLYSVRNPTDGVVSLAYSALTDRTRGASLEGVLSENLSQLAADIEAELRTRAAPFGVEIVAFTLDGLHPPVAVAEHYQAVVAAQVDRETSIIDAQGYTAARLPEAEAEAAALVAKATATRAEVLGQARGKAAAFTALASAHRRAPALFETRRRLDALETAIQGQPFTVVDSRFEAAGGVLWVSE